MASLLGTNPVELSKMKVPKEYPRPTRASEYGVLFTKDWSNP